MSQITAVIPVRFGAQRFPGKALAPILNRPMVAWVIQGVQQAQLIDHIIVATDDERIAEVCRPLGVEVVMTAAELPSGTDRVHAATQSDKNDLIINIQGDEPLITGEIIDTLAAEMKKSANWDMMTLGRTMDSESLHSPNTAKILLDCEQNAIYFSRFPIPYSREKNPNEPNACLKHIGIYGYKKGFLRRFCETPAQPLETFEGLEQLRALYLQAKIRVLKVDYQSWGVDTPEDVPLVEDLLRKRHER